MGVNGGGFGSNLGERVESLLQLADGAWKPLRGWRVLAVKAGGTILLGGLVVCVCGWVEGPSAFEQSWHDSAASAVLMAAVDTNQSAPRPIANRNLDGRHRILSKLNRIRIDEVHYDLPLAEVIKQLQMESKKRDPDGDGINFLFNMQAAGLGGAATPSEYVNEITVKIDPPLRNLRLIDVLDAIAKTASKPVRWTVEDYAVVFSPKSTGEELLYTKVFRVDPHTFVQGLQNVRSIHLNTGTQTSGTGGGGSSAGTGVEIPGVQIIPSTPAAKAGLSDATKPKNAVDPDALIRAYFAAAGVDLSKPNKVVFFDDRLGRLLVRASRSDFEIIEQAVELLNQAPSQLTIEAKFVDVEEKSLQRLGLDWIKSEEKITAILTDAQFRSALAALEQRAKTDILSAPKVTTLSGRQTHISSTNEDGGVALDILATVASDGFTVQATVIPSVRTGTQIWTVVNTCNVWDGQTLVIGGLTTNQSSKVRKMRLVFVTPTIIDRAGNRMHTDNDMPFTRNSIPPQPPTTPH